MLYTIPITASDNLQYYIFLYDTKTKSGFNEIKNNSTLLDSICKEHHIEIKLTKDTFKLVNQEPQVSIMPIITITENTCDCYIHNDFLSLQEQSLTVRNTIYQQLADEYSSIPEEERNHDELSYNSILYPLLQESLDSILEVKTSTKLDLDLKFFNSKELFDSMCSKRPIFEIPMTENQNAIQTNNEDELNVALPSLGVIRETPEDAINVLTLIRVLSPYRRYSESINSYLYESKYHTPYFRTGGDGLKVHDELAKSKLSNDFKWVYGNQNNNLLPIQTNEEKLYNNLKTLYSKDISEHLTEILTGIINTTTLGMKVNRLVALPKEKALAALDILDHNSPTYLTISMNSDILTNLSDGDILSKETVSSMFDKTITLNTEQIKLLIEDIQHKTKIIDCDNNLIKPNFIIDDEKELINLLLENGFITLHFKTFVTTMIQLAYRLNWGHTGSTKAIPSISTEAARKIFDSNISDLLNRILLKNTVKKQKSAQQSNRYSDTTGYSDEDADEDIDDDLSLELDEVYSDYPWYTSSSTRRKIKESANGYMDNDIDVSIKALDTESKIVERWRVVSGEVAISMYIDNCFTLIGKIDIYLLAVIKLLRWGDTRKPTFLIFPEFPEINTVFDLNESTVSENIFIVDEKDLIKHNGCEYTLTACLRAKSKILNTKQAPIVGFLLSKDYGKIQKHYIASWSDLFSKCYTNEKGIDIDPLIAPHFDISPIFNNIVYIEKISSTLEFEFFTSDKHIKESHEFMCQASDLSECKNLIIEDVMRSNAYKAAIKAETITTNKERQYSILNNYILRLAKLYKNCEDKIDSISTVNDFMSILKIWGNLSVGSIKKEHNEAVATNTLKKLNIGEDMGESASVDTLIEQIKAYGKYMLIVDTECMTGLPSLNFSDADVNNTALKYRNRVVLTILNGKTKDGQISIISNIDDVTDSNLMKDNLGKPYVMSYTNLIKVLEVIKKKGSCRTKSSTFYLQPTLEEKVL